MRTTKMIAAPRALLGVVALAWLATTAQADWRPVSEHWYELFIADAKAGWTHTTVERDDERYRTTSETQLAVDRGAIRVEVGSESVFLETLDGAPLEVMHTQRMSAQEVRQRWVFTDTNIEQTSWLGGRETVTQLPLPQGEWLTPQAADRFAKARREAGADSLEFRTVDPEGGVDPITITTRRTGKGTYELDGTTVPVEIWTTVTDIMPLEAVEKITAEGLMVHQEIRTGFGRMVSKISTAELAPVEGAGFSPELMVKTFVQLDEPLRDVDRLRRATWKLTARKGDLPELPTAASQRVRPGPGPRSVYLDVDMDDCLPAAPGEASDPALLASSTMVSADDPLVTKLAEKAVRTAGPDPMARAEAMRDRVHKHITRKGMQTAFASAAETARTREGDCSEHAVLLCAMLRADGIPARVASGLVYVDEFAGQEHVFGWHMWTQALIDDRWHDLDATLPQTYHAAHVLTATSNLADGSGSSDMASMIMLIGNLDIELVEDGASGDLEPAVERRQAVQPSSP